MLYLILPSIIYFIYFNIFDISSYLYSVYNKSLIIIHNVSLFIYEIVNVFTSDYYEHLFLYEKVIASFFALIYIIIYISLKFGIILINLALYSYCFLYIALPINILIFILKIINRFIRETFRDFILNDEYIYENIITDTLNSYIIIAVIIINIIIRIIHTIKSIVSFISIRINNIININKIIEQNEKLLYINKNQNKIINDLETQHYSPKLLKIRQNIINALKIQLEDKNKIIDETNKCIICINNTISYCCVPCGHTYCYDCIDKTDNCYICRGIIHNKIKLFF
jgi:hypothetical protein